MRVLLVIGVVVLVCLLLVVDRALKIIRRAERRREVNQRLAAVAAAAEARDEQRRTVREESGAITSVMPTIHDLGPRHVDLACGSSSFPIRTRHGDGGAARRQSRRTCAGLT
jgi:hypothetical protein